MAFLSLSVPTRRILSPAGLRFHLHSARPQIPIHPSRPTTIGTNTTNLRTDPQSPFLRQRISTQPFPSLRIRFIPKGSLPTVTKRHFTSGQAPTYPNGSSYSVTFAAISLCILGFGYVYYARSEASQYEKLRPGDARKYDNIKHLAFVSQNLVLNWQNVRDGRWWTMVTYSFTHFAPWHLGVNMLALLSVGPQVVANFGAGAFLLTWLGSALCGAGVSLWWEQRQAKVNKDGSKAKGGYIGASGSILGLIIVDTCMAPTRLATIIPFTPPIPQWGFATLLVGLSVAALANDWLPGLGHAGHLGGMGFGALYYYTWLRRKTRFRRF